MRHWRRPRGQPPHAKFESLQITFLDKEIGTSAREEIAEIAGAPVHLFLFVKIRERWGEDPERYREMGLDFPKDR